MRRPHSIFEGTRGFEMAQGEFSQQEKSTIDAIVNVTITPEVSSKSVNRAIITELVRLYKESDLGSRLPAYDGWESLYTAGELPFTWKEFAVKIFDEDDGVINGPRRERSYKVAIKFVARANMHHLGEFLAGKRADGPQEMLIKIVNYIKEQSHNHML